MKNSTALPHARTKDLVVRELGDETLIYDLTNDRAHCLNGTAAFIWKSCDGKTTAAKTAREMGKALRVPADTGVVWLALEELERIDLLENYKKPVDGNLVSRRTLMLKYAPAALALPVIMSISAPTAAQAASCVCPNCCPGFRCSFSGNICVAT